MSLDPSYTDSDHWIGGVEALSAAEYLAARASDADLPCGISFIVRIASEIAKDLVIWFRSHLRRRRPLRAADVL
jgi:hypothetical protein